MKQTFAITLFVAAALVSAPAFAQKEKEKEKEKEKKEVQHIIITRSGDVNEKTVVEIQGDKVLVNGKEAKDSKDVEVRVNKIKDGHAFAFGQAGRVGGNTWTMDMNADNIVIDGDNFSLFSEDSNRAMLGVVTDEDEKGAVIVEISEGGAAAKAGLKKGDIITRIDDKKIEDAEDVSTTVRAHKPGDKVDITVIRDGKEQKIAAELTKWKGVKMQGFSAPRVLEEFRAHPSIKDPGAEVRGYYMNTTPKLGLSVQDTDDGVGVKVIEVNEETNAAKAGLQENDVITHINDKAVNSTDEVTKIVKENKDKPSIQVKVLRGGKTQNIEVRMPRKIKTADL
jgi:serine protease Do